MARYRTLLIVWVALAVLAAINIGGAFLPAGNGDFILNLAVAAVMAGTVMIFFMKLRDSAGLARAFAGIGFVFLLILIGLTACDYLTRVMDRV